ncbi:4Fe-4S dicluster domain-containing protein [Candidatus Uabimicrobium sp. HlEnr_7]|uniref:4Fe-4S dicluster domain-containing protein n=1 Tax=Candidatus Uabimicrobium helgolandensis TaxID=3095367 RepID=UPI00355620B3
MTNVVTGNCHGCRYTDCVLVCPVDCFYGDDKMLYINPEECIDCGACIAECPVEAIFYIDDVPQNQQHWIQINADKCENGETTNICKKEEPLSKIEEIHTIPK